MLSGAKLVIGGTRLNRAGYPQQNPALITNITLVRKKLSSSCNDQIKLVSEFSFHFNHQTNIRTTGRFHHLSIEEVLEKINDDKNGVLDHCILLPVRLTLSETYYGEGLAHEYLLRDETLRPVARHYLLNLTYEYQ